MKKGWPARLAARALIVAFIAGSVWFVREQLLKEDPRDRRIAQRVRLLDAPKPPPPPKLEEKPVEVRPDKEIEVERMVPLDTPGPKDPGERLGLEGDGSAGGDGFGLEARRGGQDITTIGSNASPGGGQAREWSSYGTMVRRHLEALTRGEKRLQGHAFQAVVWLWVSADGRDVKFDLVGSSGDAEVDRTLRELLAGAPPLREPPPQDMPQPVRLRVTSRLSG